MTILVESYAGGRRVSYDVVKFHQALLETLVKKGILNEEEIEELYQRSR